MNLFLTSWISLHAPDWLTALSLNIHVLPAIPTFVAISILTIVFLYLTDRKCHAKFVALASGGTFLTVYVLKNFLAVARPDDALLVIDGYAFPSGHAAGSLCLALIFTLLFRSKLSKAYLFLFGCGLFSVAFIVSISRVVLSFHTPLQVAAGWAIALIWTGVAYRLYCARMR